jgi:hypothetical protein
MLELVATVPPPASPDYVLVSHDWHALRPEAGGTVQKATTFPAEDSSVAGDGVLATARKDVGWATHVGNMGDLQRSLGPIYDYGPTASEGMPTLIQTLPHNDPHAILDHIFLHVPTSALAALAPLLKKVKHRNHSASTEPSRRSCRQAAKKSVAPVTSRTTHCLMQ